MSALPALLFALRAPAPDAGAPEAGSAGSSGPDGGAAPHPGPVAATPSARTAARAAHAQAMELLRAGNIEEAAAQFAAAVEQDPGNAGYATDYGFALGRLGRRAEAEKLLRGAIEKDPHRVYAWVFLGEIYAEDPARCERRDAIVEFL